MHRLTRNKKKYSTAGHGVFWKSCQAAKDTACKKLSHCTIFASFFFGFEGNFQDVLIMNYLVKLNPSLVLASSLPATTGGHTLEGSSDITTGKL